MTGLYPIDPSHVPADIPYWVRAFGLETSFNPTPGTAVSVKYALTTTGSNPRAEPYRALSAAEIANIKTSLSKVAEHSGLQFVESSLAEADLLIGATSAASTGVYGRTWQNTTQPVEVVAYDAVYSDPTGLGKNGYIYIHEILHGVGLDHSTRAFGSTSDIVIPDDEDNGTTLYGSWGSGWNGGPQLFDLAVLQFLYGPDTSERAGNDTYSPILGAYDPTAPDENNPLLWDGAGYDTINLFRADGGAWVSLTPGVVSRVNTTDTGILEAGTFSINFGSVFERLIGTKFDDILEGHTGDETLQGRGGRDRLAGLSGDDTLSGGGGRDKLFGAAGDDTLSGDRGNDRLFGGGGQDVLIGGKGRDKMTGGADQDTFVFTTGFQGNSNRITDFQDGQDKIRFDSSLAFADLTITQAGTDTRVEWADGGVNLLNTAANSITEADFLFA